MGSKNLLGTHIVDRFVSRYPDTPTRSLARMIDKRHKHVWGSLDAIAQAIRYRRGAKGPAHRERAGRANRQPTPPSKFNALNPLRLPTSDERPWEPFVFDGAKTVLVIGDLHMPYHSLAAVTKALQHGRYRKVDGILINGDLLDFHTLSRFQKDPGKRSFKEERQTGVAFIERLRELFPKARIVYKEGNHDERLQSFVLGRAPEIYDETLFDLGGLLKLEQFGVEHVREKREVMLGKLPVLHGHELPKGIAAPVNPARGAFMRAKDCVMVSHHHRTSEHTETTISRHIIATWSLGCLCELRPLYEPFNGWNHGFATVEIASNGNFNVVNHKIQDGQLLNK